MGRAIAWLALGGVLLGCAPPAALRGTIYRVPRRPVVAPHELHVGAAEWTVTRARLAGLRRGQRTKPYVLKVRVGVDDGRGRRYAARGAVAVAPGRAARMVLLGPGGVTALDIWVTQRDYRVSAPTMRFERRGIVGDAASRALPVGLLRWWFLAPLGGRLLAGRATASEAAWLLKDAAAIVAVRTNGVHLWAVRREAGHLEGIEWVGRGVRPERGARGRYVDGSIGLRIEFVVEQVADAEPSAEAFDDPDAAGTTL